MQKLHVGQSTSKLVARVIFIGTFLFGLMIAIAIYGSSQFVKLTVSSEYALSTWLTSSAIEQIAPTPLPSPVDLTYAFTWLSLEGVPLHFPLPTQNTKSLFTKALPTISWNNLVAHVTKNISVSSRLTVGWTLDSSNQTVEQALTASPGLSVIAPKCLHVDGINGAIAGSIPKAAVTLAHKKGVQFWAVVDNGFNGPLSHKILAYNDQQNMLIAHLVELAQQSQINGINLDFEGLLPEDRWNFTDFVDKLAAALHAKHMLLSVDLPPDILPGDNTGAYNHRELAKSVNYIVLMGYDEYWGGDQVAGPTASLPWVKQSVQDMLETGVPRAKLILGVPFYTQDWTLNKNDSVLSSVALSLWQTRSILATTHAKQQWNAKLGLHVASFTENGIKHEIWVEDKRSLLLFADLVSEQHLAGAAAWYLGLETESTWRALVDTVHSNIA
ncbi:glycosyl hydrolase family 18 protein [Sulfoacidibacillus thermotolerans]|uniref:GH18 domain-containing protein n=1 Tax=Sulfoacidibacillus thermotolerans TaxID=1765684 RepID=A0A2U3DBN3_SULT2|nr:glycosyl hydrolase family 18 protein [Sulfoacidibacillus thermotolerans]PWI58687.1 hypothetical protein BM613_00895 [Sulfoacidibacillus thermotolerans]